MQSCAIAVSIHGCGDRYQLRTSLQQPRPTALCIFPRIMSTQYCDDPTQRHLGSHVTVTLVSWLSGVAQLGPCRLLIKLWHACNYQTGRRAASPVTMRMTVRQADGRGRSTPKQTGSGSEGCRKYMLRNKLPSQSNCKLTRTKYPAWFITASAQQELPNIQQCNWPWPTTKLQQLSLPTPLPGFLWVAHYPPSTISTAACSLSSFNYQRYVKGCRAGMRTFAPAAARMGKLPFCTSTPGWPRWITIRSAVSLAACH